MSRSTQRKASAHGLKAGWDMEQVGTETVSELGDKGLIKEVAGLFRLREEDLHQLENFLENFAERSAQKLVKTIQSRIIIPLHGFVDALGIPEVGKVVAGDLPISFNPWIDFVSQIHTT